MLDASLDHRLPPASPTTAPVPATKEELAPPERLARFRLARSRGIGPARFRRLLTSHGSAEAALAALGKEGSAGLAKEEAVLDEIARGHAAGAEWSVWGDPCHPLAFADLTSPPPLLWYRGNPAMLSRAAVAIVGARDASAPGRAIAREFAAALADEGLVVVSGLARGIDTEAHKGALQAARRGKGGGIAVLPCGIDRVYPARNIDLARQMADASGRASGRGCVISELPVGTRVAPRNFPTRNRLIAALARAVIIVEAAEKSGTILTARLAAELGRDVLVVPGHPHDARARGSNRLIREGAILVRDMEDVLEALASPFANPMSAPLPDEEMEKVARLADGESLNTSPDEVTGSRGTPSAGNVQRSALSFSTCPRRSSGTSTPTLPSSGRSQASDRFQAGTSTPSEPIAPVEPEVSLRHSRHEAEETAGSTKSGEAAARCSQSNGQGQANGQGPTISSRVETSGADPAEKAILGLFTQEPVLEDRILREAEMPVRKVIALITQLEIKGYLARLPDGRVQKLRDG